MEIIVEKVTNLIKYAGYVYDIKDECTDISIDGNIIRCDLSLNHHNAFQVTLESEIPFFVGDKYIYDDGVILENPDYVLIEG